MEHISKFSGKEAPLGGRFVYDESLGHVDAFSHPNSVFAGGPRGPVYDKIKNIFVSNGDHLSLQYTETKSNISRVTKQGGQGVLGKLEQWAIGATRYYQCVMNDDFKH